MLYIITTLRRIEFDDLVLNLVITFDPITEPLNCRDVPTIRAKYGDQTLNSDGDINIKLCKLYVLCKL